MGGLGPRTAGMTQGESVYYQTKCQHGSQNPLPQLEASQGGIRVLVAELKETRFKDRG